MKTHVKLLVLAMVLVMFTFCLAACVGGGNGDTTTTEAPATTTTAAPETPSGEGFDVVIANQGAIPFTGSALNVATIVKPEGIGGVRTALAYKLVDASGATIKDLGNEKPVDCGKYTVTVTFTWQDTAKEGVPCAPITKEFTVVAGELEKQHKNFSAKDSETLFKTTNMSYDPLNDSDLLVGNLPKGVVRVATITKYDPDTQTAGAATAVAGKITTTDGAGYYKVTITYVEEEGKDNFSDEATLSDTAIVYVRPINKTANKVATNAITVDGEIESAYGAPVFETKYQAHVTKDKDGKQVFDKIDLTEGKFVNPYEYAALMEISKGANITVDATNYNYATAKFYAVWDGDYVYIAIEVTDTTPYARTAAYTSKPNPWINDNVELYYRFGGDNAPKIESGDTYPTYKTLVRDSVTGNNVTATGDAIKAPTAIKSQKSHYFDDVKCAVAGRDTVGDNTYVIEYKLPAKTETYSGTPGATGDQAFKTIAGENLVAGDFIYLAYQLNDLTGLPGNVSAEDYDAQIGDTVTGNKYKDMDYGTAPEKDSPWYNFEFDAAAYIYSAGNRAANAYLKVDTCAPMILALGN